jgi:hypothetical protein
MTSTESKNGYVMTPAGTVAETVHVSEASKLREQREVVAAAVRAARAEVERIGRAAGQSALAWSRAGRVLQELWNRAVALNITHLKGDGADGDHELRNVLDEIRRAELGKTLVEKTSAELELQLVAARIPLLMEEARLKSIAAKFLRASAAERMASYDLQRIVDGESEVQIHSERVEQEYAIASSFEEQAAALDKQREQLEFLYGQMKAIAEGNKG